MKANWGWIVTGILLAVILWLIFRPVPTFNNKQAIKTIDSLTTVNKGLRKALEAVIKQENPLIDSLYKATDSLKDHGKDLARKLNASEAAKLSLAQQVEWYATHQHDSVTFDEACLTLARKVISDSAIIRDYQINTNNLVTNFGSILNGKDSIIIAQTKVIWSDSVVMAQQKALNDLQQKQLKTATNRGKITAWLARSLALTSMVLAGILLSK